MANDPNWRAKDGILEAYKMTGRGLAYEEMRKKPLGSGHMGFLTKYAIYAIFAVILFGVIYSWVKESTTDHPYTPQGNEIRP